MCFSDGLPSLINKLIKSVAIHKVNVKKKLIASISAAFRQKHTALWMQFHS